MFNNKVDIMAIKSFSLKQIIEQMDKFANFTINRGMICKQYYHVIFECYDNGVWRPYDYIYTKKYLFQTWKENTDRDIKEYIDRYK